MRRARAAVVIRWATVLPMNHPEVAMMNKVAADMKQQTGGAVEIQIFPSGQLGSSRDIIESASSGAIQLVDEGAAQFGQFVPPFSILEAPYLWRDPAHIRRALAAPLMEPMVDQLIAERSLRMIGSTYYGTRHVTSGTQAIHTVDDMKGFKLRIPEVDTYRCHGGSLGRAADPAQHRRALPGAQPGRGGRRGKPAADHPGQQVQRGAEIPGPHRAYHDAAARS